jgi:copper chaperone
MEKTTIHITGMACGGCSSTIATALRAISGVIEAEVSHTEGTAEVSFNPAKVQVAQLKAAIDASGYKAQ